MSALMFPPTEDTAAALSVDIDCNSTACYVYSTTATKIASEFFRIGMSRLFWSSPWLGSATHHRSYRHHVGRFRSTKSNAIFLRRGFLAICYNFFSNSHFAFKPAVTDRRLP